EEPGIVAATGREIGTIGTAAAERLGKAVGDIYGIARVIEKDPAQLPAGQQLVAKGEPICAVHSDVVTVVVGTPALIVGRVKWVRERRATINQVAAGTVIRARRVCVR